MNSLISCKINSLRFWSRVTEEMGLRLRGCPKGLHSAPAGMYMVVQPSCICMSVYIVVWVLNEILAI